MNETEDGHDESVILIAKRIRPAAMGYRWHRFCEQTHAIKGSIGRCEFGAVNDTGASVELFNGAPCYAETHFRKSR